MKTLILLTFTFISTLFANYNFNGENMGKIDMHGGKKEKLTNKFTSPNFNSLKDMSISKPLLPAKPNKLIKEKKKEKGK